MKESFIQAAGRHLYDAEILLAQHRWDNAAYVADTEKSLPILSAGNVDNNYLEKLARLDCQNLLKVNNLLTLYIDT